MTPTPLNGELFDANELLRIDVDAEIRKLTSAQLQGPWQLGPECIRLVTQCGATSVELQSCRGGFELVAVGAAIDADILAALAPLLSRDADSSARHRALERIESSQRPTLLALAGSSLTELCIESHDPSRSVISLRWERDHAPRFETLPTKKSLQMRIAVRAKQLERHALLHSLRELCRFSELPIRIDGQPVYRELENVLARVRLNDAPSGIVAILGEGEQSRLWLLQDGIIRAHVSLPQRPWFVAHLELNGLVAPQASPADLRTRLESELPSIVDHSINMLRALAQGYERLAPVQSQRVRKLVLLAARDSQLRPRLQDLALFEVYRDLESRTRWSLAQLQQLIDPQASNAIDTPAQNRHVLQVIGPDENPREHNFDDHLLVIDDTSRSLLSELLGTSLAAAPLRQTAIDRGLKWRQRFALARVRWRARGSFRGACERLWTRLHPPLAPKSIEPAMAALIAALSRGLPDGRRVFAVSGQGRPAWRGKTLLLPQKNPVVRHAIAAWRNNTANAYPVMLALLDGLRPPTSVRNDGWPSFDELRPSTQAPPRTGDSSK